MTVEFGVISLYLEPIRSRLALTPSYIITPGRPFVGIILYAHILIICSLVCFVSFRLMWLRLLLDPILFVGIASVFILLLETEVAYIGYIL